MYRVLTNLDKENLIDDYKNGIVLRDLCEKYNTYDTLIYKLLKEKRVPNQLSLRESAEVTLRPWTNVEETRKPYFEGKSRRALDHSYFEEINTQEKAYWLGFLAADGYVCNTPGKPYTIRLKLQVRDSDHVDFLQHCIQSQYSSWIEDNKGHPAYAHQFKSKKMFDDLAKYHITPNKVSTVEFPSIPAPLKRHFIRGYTDADGHWTTSTYNRSDTISKSLKVSANFGISSNLGVLEEIQERMCAACLLSQKLRLLMFIKELNMKVTLLA